MEQGRGPVGVALVEQGVLKPGDFVVSGSTYAKVRNLESTSGDKLKEAKASTPVILTGFKDLPRFGDEFSVVKNEKIARNQSEENKNKLQKENKNAVTSGDLIRIIDRQKQVNELNIVIKADVQGSTKSVIDSLKSLNTEEVAVRIVGSSVGGINEGDVHLAATSGAIIYGFNVETSNNVRQKAARDRVKLRLFPVIYELIDDVKAELVKLLPDEIIRTDLGRLLVRGIFKITKNEVICGGEVTKGKLIVPSLATIYSGDDVIADKVEVVSLKRGPQEAKEVAAGEMCGVSFKSQARVDLSEGDRIEFFTVEVKERSLG